MVGVSTCKYKASNTLNQWHQQQRNNSAAVTDLTARLSGDQTELQLKCIFAQKNAALHFSPRLTADAMK